MRMIVGERREVADGVVSLTLARADGGPLPAWSPGAHVELALDNGLTRPYSLCSDPRDPRTWRIGVRRAPESRGGSRFVVDKLHGGDTVEVGEPRNHFRLDPAPGYVFVAGGIGITPILPMVAEAQRSGARWTLLYGGRDRASMPFLDELARHGDRVTLVPQDEAGLPDLDGPLATSRPGTLVYACGPGPLLDAVGARTGHWPAGSLRVERFTPPAVDPVAVDEAFEVEFALSGVTATVPAGTSILSAAEGVGIAADWSCREGACGSCETPLLSGRAEHRDVLLTEEERQEQSTLMICVSRAERGCARLRLGL